MNDEQTYFDLSVAEGREAYAEYVRKIATTWAENFEECGGGDGEPYQAGEGHDLWIDVIERWEDDYYDLNVVSDLNEAYGIGAATCAEVVAALVTKRSKEEGGPQND